MIQLIGHFATPIAQAQPDWPVAASVVNLLVNPDFEDGFYIPDPAINSVRVPIGWHIRWYTDTAPVPPWGTPEQFQFFPARNEFDRRDGVAVLLRFQSAATRPFRALCR